MSLHTKQKETHRLRDELMIPEGEKGWGKKQRVWDGHVHPAIFEMDNQQGPNL